jgi:hypothetical protein
LRAQVLDAVDAGISPTVIGRVCGVTRNQLGQWQRWRRVWDKPRSHGRGDPQVLTVIDSQAEQVATEEVALDVGVGRWRLSIRLCPNDVAGR